MLPPGVFDLQTDGEELYKAGHACRLRSLVVMRLRFPVSYCGYEAPPIIICMEIISASAVDIIFDNSIPSPEDDGKDWMKWLAHVRVVSGDKCIFLFFYIKSGSVQLYK